MSMTPTNEQAEPLYVAPTLLSPEAFKSLVEEFVTRDGTEYGSQQFSLDEKVEQVQSRINAGDAKIVYDADSCSCSIIAE